MTIDHALIDQLLKDYQKPEDVLGEDGLLKQLTKAVLERAMQAELTEHLGYEKPGPGRQELRQLPQRQVKEDAQGRLRPPPARGPPRPQRDLRAADHPQGADPL